MNIPFEGAFAVIGICATLITGSVGAVTIYFWARVALTALRDKLQVTKLRDLYAPKEA